MIRCFSLHDVDKRKWESEEDKKTRKEKEKIESNVTIAGLESHNKFRSLAGLTGLRYNKTLGENLLFENLDFFQKSLTSLGKIDRNKPKIYKCVSFMLCFSPPIWSHYIMFSATGYIVGY